MSRYVIFCPVEGFYTHKYRSGHGQYTNVPGFVDAIVKNESGSCPIDGALDDLQSGVILEWNADITVAKNKLQEFLSKEKEKQDKIDFYNMPVFGKGSKQA